MADANELPEPCPHGGDPIECMSCLIDEYGTMKEAFTAIGIPPDKLPGLVEGTLGALYRMATLYHAAVCYPGHSWRDCNYETPEFADARALHREWGEAKES